jgi:hypothetical protein
LVDEAFTDIFNPASRIRHLKCDEEKPICQRCQSDQRVCDGYSARPEHRSENKEAKPYDPQQVNNHSPPNTPSLPLQATASTNLNILPQVESCILQDFSLASPLAPKNASLGWALPVHASSEPVRSALCALDIGFKYFMRRHRTECMVESSSASSEMASIQAYNQAIRTVQLYIIPSSQMGVETVVACCLIFACIEAFHDRYTEVTCHLEAVFSLLPTCSQSDRSELFSFVRSPKPFEEEDDVFIFVNHLTDQLCRLKMDYSSPIASVSNNQVVWLAWLRLLDYVTTNHK